MKKCEGIVNSNTSAEPKPWVELNGEFRPGLIADVRARVAGFNLTSEGRRYLRFAIEAPSRRVRSSPKSFSGTFPSRKMGASIAFESRTLELPTVVTLEHDDEALAFFDQPPSVAVKYKRDGRRRSYRQTPDFLVVRGDCAVLIECKPLEQIALRNSRDPGFYVQEGTKWVCPALQEAARELGMRHEMWTEDSFSLIRLRNLRMVGDYMQQGTTLDCEEAFSAIREVLKVKARVTVEELLKVSHDNVWVDHVYSAIARGQVGFDWEAAPLAEPHRCYVYRDEGTRRAFERSALSRVASGERIVGADMELGAGARLDWDGAIWTCINAGRDTIALSRDGRHEMLPRTVVNMMLTTGAIKPAQAIVADAADHDPEVFQRISKASENDLRTANLRHIRIARYLVPGAHAPACRTDRRYLANYRQAEVAYGNGYLGLLPKFSVSGNRVQRLMSDVLEIAIRIVNERYLTSTNLHKKAVFCFVDDECKAQSLPAPSYAWFCRFIDKLPAYKALRARKGSKGAYALETRQHCNDRVDQMEPERAFERAHVDHTLIDVETLFGETSEPLGRCWLTVMIDHHSRRILAHYLTYDPPSYRSVLMVMRKCVQRHCRLPESLVVDGGREFQSVWFETSAAIYKIKIVRRPVSKGRYGSQIERFFGTANSNVFHFLQGNTQLRKNVRQMTDEVDPNRHAVWTLPELNKALVQYFYEVYEMLEHRETLLTPRFAFEKSMERHGKRPDRHVVDNELFRITTSPAPTKGTAKVQADGVKIHYLYYSCPELQAHVGKRLHVRYDPFSKSLAWAFANGRWLRLRSRNHELLRDVTEHDLDLVATEWRKRRSAVEKTRLSEPVLVKFLKEITDTEVLLLARKRAAEERRVRQEDFSGDGWEEEGGSIDRLQDSSSPPASSVVEIDQLDHSHFAALAEELEILEVL